VVVLLVGVLVVESSSGVAVVVVVGVLLVVSVLVLAFSSMWSANSNTGVPEASTSSMMSIMPSSKPAPFATRRSAFSIDSAWRADGAKSWGSDPTPMMTSTSASSPTAWVTMSPRMLVVTTIVGTSTSTAGASVATGASVVATPSVVAVAAAEPVDALESLVSASDVESSDPQATPSTPSEQAATT
jgi:hypothetical protein